MQHLTHSLLRGLASLGGLGVHRREPISGSGVGILGVYSKSKSASDCYWGRGVSLCLWLCSSSLPWEEEKREDGKSQIGRGQGRES